MSENTEIKESEMLTRFVDKNQVPFRLYYFTGLANRLAAYYDVIITLAFVESLGRVSISSPLPR